MPLKRPAAGVEKESCFAGFFLIAEEVEHL